MNIDVERLREEGELDLAETVSLPRIAQEVVDIESLDEVNVHLHATYHHPYVIVQGELETVVHYVCARCLTEFTRPLSASFHERYTTDEQKAEDEVRFVGDELVDVTPELEQAIFLTIDNRPLCKETCQGLCPVCGRDRNVEACGCDVRPIDPRLEALKGLLSEHGSE
ncbi:DUF177 domain-containing protein [Alicyclobacillus mali]|uniref:DUF177 domain-containing protein n=1 Tax=Alicyclobacillus mali (ex Roth et al. 2021) TaxID=1123961 RepID=A0ABS0F4W2_9BACL|nr:DUF177 domain-containing protein [Alicyclobacillus mali (ex Roth et al. 2021)]MBF8378345.1 DUF177 domain-containing protein [Alicyclobacillus mali (ex Roth et al. 2021)]MCL6489376.1 DUF177 domain-containing protein [Alicyclobacillus mali (ex Roth et al. 2021)]